VCGGSAANQLCISPSHLLGLTVQGSLYLPCVLHLQTKNKYALCNCKLDTGLCWMKPVTPTNEILTVLLVQGARMQKRPFSYLSHSQTCLCTTTCKTFQQAEHVGTLSIFRGTGDSCGEFGLSWLLPEAVLVIQMIQSHKSGLAEILSLAQMLHEN